MWQIFLVECSLLGFQKSSFESTVILLYCSEINMQTITLSFEKISAIFFKASQVPESLRKFTPSTSLYFIILIVPYLVLAFAIFSIPAFSDFMELVGLL